MSLIRVGSTLSGLFMAVALGACSSLLGIDEYSVWSDAGDSGGLPVTQRCTTNRQCSERLAAQTGEDASGGGTPALCVPSTGQCVGLLSEDCHRVTGDYTDDRAIVIGSLFSLSGPQANTNLARQQSAALAIEEINAVGGIPVGATSADSRPLVLVSCDESVELLRAGRHLIEELHVPAIVGPNTSQDTLDLSNKLSIGAHTVVLSPTAVASSIADLLDEGMTWQITPTDVQRAPLTIEQINELEARMRLERKRSTIKLGVVYRDDALGQGTRISLNTLMFNGKPLVDPVNLGNNVRIDPYDYHQPDQKAIVDAYLSFAPDIVVLGGTAEVITHVMLPLEQRWQGPKENRPQYLLIESAKVPELLDALVDNDDLRHRIRGTGVTPGMRSIPVNEAFTVSYAARYPGEPTGISGMGAAYDSTYALAYAMASLRGAPVTGPNLAQGLRGLGRGGMPIEVQRTQVLAAFRRLAAGEGISAIGTFSTLQWTDNGSLLGGTLEMWCVSRPDGKPAFDRSGLTFDVALGQSSGQYTQCE